MVVLLPNPAPSKTKQHLWALVNHCKILNVLKCWSNLNVWRQSS